MNKKMNLGETIFLWIMLIAFVITGLVLLYDEFGLNLRGKETISDHIGDNLQKWKDGGYKLDEFPILTILLPFGVSMQAVGLLGHLISYLYR